MGSPSQCGILFKLPPLWESGQRRKEKPQALQGRMSSRTPMWASPIPSKDVFPLSPSHLVGPWPKRLFSLRQSQTFAFPTQGKSLPFFDSHLLISEMRPTIPTSPRARRTSVYEVAGWNRTLCGLFWKDTCTFPDVTPVYLQAASHLCVHSLEDFVLIKLHHIT